jgi:hypothetical protein
MEPITTHRDLMPSSKYASNAKISSMERFHLSTSLEAKEQQIMPISVKNKQGSMGQK